MTTSPARVLLAYFIEEGALKKWGEASRTQWAGTVGQMPDGQGVNDNLVTIYNTGTYYQGRYATGGRPDKYNVQIRIRSKTEDDGFRKGVELQEILDAVVRYSLVVTPENSDLPDGETELVRIDAANTFVGLAAMGQEEKNRRFHHTINVRLTLTGADEL